MKKILFINNKKIIGDIQNCIPKILPQEGLLPKANILDIKLNNKVTQKDQYEISQNVNQIDRETGNNSDLHFVWTSFDTAVLYYSPKKHEYLLLDE